MHAQVLLQPWPALLFAAFQLVSAQCANGQAQKPQFPAPALSEQAAQETSSQSKAELQIGIALTRSGKFVEAIPHLLAARGHVSNEYAAEFDLALCFVGTGESKKAIPILLGLRYQGHENADVESLLSQAYSGNDEPKKAFEAFQKAAAFTPKD